MNSDHTFLIGDGIRLHTFMGEISQELPVISSDCSHKYQGFRQRMGARNTWFHQNANLGN